MSGASQRDREPRVPEDIELRRTLPVIKRLRLHGVRTGIDTTRTAVADVALGAGADVVNDVSGGLADPHMAKVVANAGVPFVVMHWRGHSDHMRELARYEDVVEEVSNALRRRVDDLASQGVERSQMILDPGLGFAKNASHDWELLAHLEVLKRTGHPVLVGASRKFFLRDIPSLAERRLGDLDGATAAISAIAAASGIWGVRVHDVRASVDAVAVARRLRVAQ